MSLYEYKINKINLKNGISIAPKRINIFVGANNCGKTQLLKDILTYVTGENTTSLLVNELDIPYPDSFESFLNSYPINIVETNRGNSQLQIITPTLDASPTGLQSNTLIEDLNNRLTRSDKQSFRKAIGQRLITFLNTDNRLGLVKKCSVENLHQVGAKNVLEALYQADISAPSRIRKLVIDAFQTDIYFDYTDPGTLQFRIGDNFSNISEDSRTAYKQIQNFPTLDCQGDGIRSYVGIISALISLTKPIILLDEPEAFLHPPQAMQLGANISNLIDDSQQIFISTHSADFMRGLLSSTSEVNIIHLNRTNNSTTEVNILNPDVLKKVISDPLLSSSRVLEGMFYKGVVVTEADADAVFYQRIYNNAYFSDEIHFVNAHNKQTLKKVITPYQALGIKFALIADADVIRDGVEFKSIVDDLVADPLKQTILTEREAVYNHFQKLDKHSILTELRTQTIDYASKDIPPADSPTKQIESALHDFRKKLKDLRDDADELISLKKEGRKSLEKIPTILLEFDNLIKHCASIGLFIVPVGELESWLVDYDISRSNNKKNWIVTALNKLPDISYDPNKEIWKFIDSLRKHLIK